MINWNMIAACAAALAALASVITAGVIVWQTSYTLRIQTLNQMLAAWQSPPMFPLMRQQAAKVLWIHVQDQTRPKTNRTAEAAVIANLTSFNLNLYGDTSHVDAVLDFFEMITLFAEKKILDFEMIYNMFSWEMCCYWLLTENYIAVAQEQEDAELWIKYSTFMPRIIERSRKKVTLAQAKEFLLDEQIRTKEY